MSSLLALHGQTLTGAFMRRELAHLEHLGVELVCPDGPLVCADDTVDRLYAVWVPPIAYVIVIAGRTPRADVFTPCLADPIRPPSLHVWGDHDRLVPKSPAAEAIELFIAGQIEELD